MHSPEQPMNSRMDRRRAIKWMLTVASGIALPFREELDAQPAAASAPDLPERLPGIEPVLPVDDSLESGGYGTDPDLQKIYKTGELWPLTFTEPERRTAGVLADIIIPADAVSPKATEVGVLDFLDEWVSAPYRSHRRDRKIIRAGLAWLDEEATLRFANNFADITPEQQIAICDDICSVARASASHLTAARFFGLFRDLVSGGFYTTKIGWADVKYVGNVASVSFAGPPDSVLKKLGII